MKLLLFACAAVSATLAEDRFYEFVATPVVDDTLSPDCFSKRPMFLINGEFPGPIIEADEGDVIHVQLTNKHPSETLAVHFHGIHQKGSVYSDGAASISQCGLNPHQTQNLSFIADPSGTHYWHAHQSLLMNDGIAGPVIVHPTGNVNLPDYDEDVIIFLQDWYHTTSTNQRTGLDSEPFVWIGNPDTLLINGKGAFSGCQRDGGDSGSEQQCLATCNDTAALLERIQVEEGKTYRLRLINSGQLLPVNFAIAEHDLTIFEADGTLIEPVQVPNLDISPGQRYSVLLTANKPSNSTTDVYWIRTVGRGRDVDAQGLAVIDYGTDNTTLPAPDSEPMHPAWDDEDAGPALDAMLLTQDPDSYDESIALSSNVTANYIMVGTQARRFEDNRLRWAVNNVSDTHEEPEPLIVKARRTALADTLAAIPNTVDVSETPPVTWNYTDLVDADGGPGIFLEDVMPLVLRLKKGDVVDIVMQNSRALNGVAEVHPWHIHGHAFWVVGQGTGTFDPETDPATFNLVNPVLRDTFTVWALGWTAIRLLADNPGAWPFHCHILSHLEMGMGLSVIVSAEDVPEPPPGAVNCAEASLTGSDGNEPSTSAALPAYQKAISSLITTTLVVLAAI